MDNDSVHIGKHTSTFGSLYKRITTRVYSIIWFINRIVSIPVYNELLPWGRRAVPDTVIVVLYIESAQSHGQFKYIPDYICYNVGSVCDWVDDLCVFLQ